MMRTLLAIIVHPKTYRRGKHEAFAERALIDNLGKQLAYDAGRRAARANYPGLWK